MGLFYSFPINVHETLQEYRRNFWVPTKLCRKFWISGHTITRNKPIIQLSCNKIHMRESDYCYDIVLLVHFLYYGGMGYPAFFSTYRTHCVLKNLFETQMASFVALVNAFGNGAVLNDMKISIIEQVSQQLRTDSEHVFSQ
ncbi:15757_t:CDS:2 [Racocetra persica]|uniref:15757_t:CDS:1 n=1 Tax=Racocetra persica TaxID=160502 RepID=A0ACA9N3R6_9GLOM|nr:15757_t:CDS:2 [Racocetra persica]